MQALTIALAGLLAYATFGGCARGQGPRRAHPDGAAAASHAYLREVFTDTVYLSDYAVASAAGLGGGTTYVLPQAISFVRCDFRGPVYAGRHERDRLEGGSLSFAESTFSGEVDLRRASLSHDLTLYALQARAIVRLDGIRVGGVVDLRRGTFVGDVRLPSASTSVVTADNARFEAGLSMQRAIVRESLTLVEAEVDGYLDLSYLTCHGGLHLEHLDARGRASLDYAEVRGRWAMHGAQFAETTLRYSRAWRGIEALPEGLGADATEGRWTGVGERGGG